MAQTTERRYMGGQEFIESGLLYYVNSTVLWPLGIALAVSRKDDGTYKPKISIIAIEDPEVIVDNGPDEDDHPRYRAAVTIAERLAKMPPKDRELAEAILKDPINTSAFLTPEPDAVRVPRPLPDAD